MKLRAQTMRLMVQLLTIRQCLLEWRMLLRTARSAERRSYREDYVRLAAAELRRSVSYYRMACQSLGKVVLP